MANLKLQQVSRSYGKIDAMKRVSFEVEDGEFFCLFGASSAGKTTTLRAIAGLEPLQEGTVLFNDQDITLAPVQGRGMAMIFQTFALYPHLSVRANLEYPLRRDGLDRAEIRRRVDEVAELLRINHTLVRKPGTLSGGEQQRVAICRAIVQQPQLLLLDEPLTNLDAKLRHDMRAEFKRLHRELGMTMLYATPDQLEALSMGERIAIIKAGEIVETGRPQELYGRPAHTYVARMIGSPPINLLEGEVQGSGRQQKLALAVGEFDLGDVTSISLSHGDKVTLGIRPHDIALDDSQAAASAVRLPGRVHLTEPLGDVTVLDVDVRGKIMRMVLAEEAAAAYRPGQDIGLSFQLANAHVFMTETGVRLN